MFVVAETVVIEGPRAIVRIFVSSCQTPNSTARTDCFDASACTIPRSLSASRLGAGDPSAAVEAEATKDKKAMRGRRFAIMEGPSLSLGAKVVHDMAVFATVDGGHNVSSRSLNSRAASQALDARPLRRQRPLAWARSR